MMDINKKDLKKLMIARVPIALAIIHFLLLYTYPIHAQQFSMQSLPNQSLLPVSHITSMLQDKEGYFWYGTAGGGICRDNGYQIDIIRNDRNHPGMIANNDVHSIIEDTQHQSILFSTWAGLYELSKINYKVQHIGISSFQPVFSIALDINGQIWACGTDYIWILDAQRKLRKQLPYPTSCKKSIHFFPTPDGNLWAIGNGKLYLASGTKLKSVTLNTPAHILCISQDILGQYWVGTNQGIKLLTLNGNKATLQTSMVQTAVSNLTCDKRGLLWAITNKHLAAYTTQGKELHEAPFVDFLSYNLNLIDGIYVSRNGQVCIYGQSPHTFILSLNKRDVINEGSRFPSVPQSIYCQMTSGPYIWASQWNQPLLVYNRTNGFCQNVQKTCPNLGSLQFAFSRTTDGKGVWNGTNRGEVVRLWMDGEQVKHELTTQVDSRVLSTAEYQNKLFIGTLHNLYIFDLKTRKLKLVRKNIGGVTQMQVSTDGWIYFTLEGNGLGRIRGDGHCKQMLPGMIFTDIVEDANHQLWVASKLGSVYHYNRRSGKLDEDTLAGNENGDIIYMMEADERGHLWILSDQHLKEYNPKTHAVRIFHCTDADIQMDCFQNICLTDGLICLAGLGGYRLIKPSAELDVHQAPHIKLALSNYNINGQHYIAGTHQKELKLYPDDSNLELFFTAFNITDRNNIRFKCKLEGWDKQWHTLPTGSNSIQYINLKHGHYRLWGCISDAYGRWTYPLVLLEINRLPAWYETWWFYTLLSTLLFVLLIYCVAFYMRRKFNRRIFLSSNQTEQEKLISLTAEEEKFVNKAYDIVKAHLADESFNVDQFSSEMCMSRMNLYRKMQAIMGFSPSTFIRSERLKQAAELIKHQDIPLTEVSTLVGFSSPAYFSKCFHDMFGVPPSQYAKHS